jgi:hypothetical protein
MGLKLGNECLHWALLKPSRDGAAPNRRLEMANTVTITLPATHVVTSRDKNVEIDLASLSPEIIGRLALHGLTQKVADSAASAMADAGFAGQSFKELPDADKEKVRGFAVEAMRATADSLIKGEWTERKAAESVDPLTARIRKLMGELLRGNPDKSAWKPFKDAEPAERGKMLDKLFADQSDDFQAELTAQAKAELEAERKAKAKLSKLSLGPVKL